MPPQTPFPAELWLQILEHLDPSSKVSVLKTCAFLRGVAEASLYVTVVIRQDRVVKRVKLFRCTLQSRPDLGQYTRHFKHSGVDHEMLGIAPRIPFPAKLTRLSALLPNLTTMSLRGFKINAAFCDAVVRQWPQLHTLHLDGCSIAREVRPGALAKSGIVDLLVANPEGFDNNWDALVPAAKLRTLALQAPGYLYMNMLLGIVFPLHATHGFPSLTELWIYGTHFTLRVHELFVHTPNLRRISLRRVSATDDHLNLSPHMIPHLEYYEGPARCMGVYVCGRPVHTVKIHTRDYWNRTPADDFLRALEGSTRPVTLLVLNDRPAADIDPFVMMPHAPRSLEALGFDGMRRTDVLEYLKALPPLPALRRINVDYDVAPGHVRTKEMLEVAELSRVDYPELWEVVMGRDTWFLGDDDVWTEWKRYDPSTAYVVDYTPWDEQLHWPSG